MWQGSGIRMDKRLPVGLDEKRWHTIPLYILLEAKHGQPGGKGHKSDPAPPPAGRPFRGLGLLVTLQHPHAHVGMVLGIGFVRASLTRTIHGKPFLKREGSWFLNLGFLLVVCFFFSVSKIRLRSILTPCK